MKEGYDKPINMNINSETWKKVGIMAADLEISKKEVVTVALNQYWAMFKDAKK